jgi:hypothetical protein
MQVREVSIESVNGYVKLGRNYNLCYAFTRMNERTNVFTPQSFPRALNRDSGTHGSRLWV